MKVSNETQTKTSQSSAEPCIVQRTDDGWKSWWSSTSSKPTAATTITTNELTDWLPTILPLDLSVSFECCWQSAFNIHLMHSTPRVLFLYWLHFSWLFTELVAAACGQQLVADCCNWKLNRLCMGVCVRVCCYLRVFCAVIIGLQVACSLQYSWPLAWWCHSNANVTYAQYWCLVKLGKVIAARRGLWLISVGYAQAFSIRQQQPYVININIARLST